VTALERWRNRLRSPWGRGLAGLVGLSVLVFQVIQTGPREVWFAVTRAPALFPALVLLEAGTVACEVWGLYRLYGDARRNVPALQLVRSSLIAYAVMSVAPMGRAVAEAARAALLSRYVGGPLAAAAAARMQAVALIGNACISVPCAVVALAVVGKSWLTVAVAANCGVTLALGAGVLLAGRRSRIGAWIAAKIRPGSGWGASFDDHLRTADTVPLAPLAGVFAGRCIQVFQRMLLLASVGAGFGVVKGFLAEGVHLVNGSIGDLIPGQVGLSEATYRLSSTALAISPSDGVAIALIAHLAQLFWLLVGALVPLAWPAPRDSLSHQPVG
jgi:hypothetical protein